MKRIKAFPTVRQVTKRIRHMMADLTPHHGVVFVTLLTFHPEPYQDRRSPGRPHGWYLEWGSERHYPAARGYCEVAHGDAPSEVARVLVQAARSDAKRAWDVDDLRRFA